MNSILPLPYNNNNNNNKKNKKKDEESKKHSPIRMETLPSDFMNMIGSRKPMNKARTSRFNSLPINVELSAIKEHQIHKRKSKNSRRHTVGSTLSIDPDETNLYYNDAKKLIAPIEKLLHHFVEGEGNTGSAMENALLSFQAKINSVKMYATGKGTIGLHSIATHTSIVNQERAKKLIDMLTDVSQCCWLGGERVSGRLMNSGIVKTLLKGLRTDSFPTGLMIAGFEFIGELCRCQKEFQSHLATLGAVDILINCMDDSRMKIRQAAVSALMLLLCNHAENQELALLDLDFLIEKLSSFEHAIWSQVWYPYNPVEEIKIMLDIIPPNKE